MVCPNLNPSPFDKFASSVVSKLSAAEPLITIQIEAAVSLVKVWSVLDLTAVGQLLRVQARTAFDEQGEGRAVHRVATALKKGNSK